MQNDKQITLSVAGSRKAVNWQPQSMLLSELWQKLGTSVQGVETLAEYLSMKKYQQDDRKDIGGFVGGMLAGRRKKINVKGRDIITLDLDNLPPGSTEDVLRRCGGLGAGYCVYSTRKHSPDAPRLRIVVPTDRTMQPDEYEPIARRLAQMIQPDMTWFDPTTFQLERLMYWPSKCADAEYVFTYEDKPFLSTDGMLGLYENWRAVSAWPIVPGEAKLRDRSRTKQGDPTEKRGIVGAFCRVYDVPAAMEKYLPGVYTESDIPGRYTYTEGSTAGGAVLYDDGKFLYSHHATDPCGGVLVNAFDLVRLHRFAEDDDAAKEDTPVNRLPSFEAMCELAAQDEAVSELQAKERSDSALADFEGLLTDESARLAFGKCAGKSLSGDVVETAIRALGITARSNLITGRAEIVGLPDEFSKENAINTLPVFLMDKLRAVGVKGANKTAINDYLSVVFDKKRYNPVTDILKANVWDGEHRIVKLLGILGVQTGSLGAALVEKWLIQCVALANNSLEKQEAGEGVLTLQGAQGIGKTLFFRKVAVRPEWFVEGCSLDFRNKDTLISATAGWIAELGELDSTLRRDQSNLKAFLTSPRDNLRAPYAREASIVPRRTSFCATVNPGQFLRDDTGDRRFWVVSVEHMDIQALLALDEPWLVQLWAEVNSLWLEKPQGYRLDKEERRALDNTNQKFRESLPGEEEILQVCNFDLPPEQWNRFTASDLRRQLNIELGGLTTRHIGRALAKIEKENAAIVSNVVRGIRRYQLPINKVITDFQDVKRGGEPQSNTAYSTPPPQGGVVY